MYRTSAVTVRATRAASDRYGLGFVQGCGIAVLVGLSGWLSFAGTLLVVRGVG